MIVQLPDIAAGVAALSLTLAGITAADLALPRPKVADYLDVRAVTVRSTPGDPVLLHVDRSIGLPFLGSYTVTIRESVPGGWRQVCYAESTPIAYRPDAVLPDAITIDWWTGGRCGDPGPGVHVIDTVWRLRLPSGDAEVFARSNEFEVKG